MGTCLEDLANDTTRKAKDAKKLTEMKAHVFLQEQFKLDMNVTCYEQFNFL